MLAQSFVSCEKESLVLADGTSDDAAKLVALERRYRIRRPIEEILCIQRRVAMKFEHRAVKGIRARASDGVDDSSCRAAKFGRVCIGQHLKLEDGIDAQKHATYRAGRLVIDVIDVRAIQEKIVVFGARTINGDLRRATAYDVTAGRQRRRNSGLQQCQLLKRAAVQWQVPDLLVVYQSAHRGGSCIDRGRLSKNIDLAGNIARRKRHVNDEFLPNCQFDFLSQLFLKTVRRNQNLIFTRRKQRYHVSSGSISFDLPRRIRVDIPRRNLGRNNCRSIRIGDDSLNAGTDGLRRTRTNAN